VVRWDSVAPATRRLRQPPFGRHGNKVVAFLCGWELLALPHRSPIPTVSQTVGRAPVFGVALLGLLAHHWYLEEAVDLGELVVAMVSGEEIPPRGRKLQVLGRWVSHPWSILVPVRHER
jgi:hypothetical protein